MALIPGKLFAVDDGIWRLLGLNPGLMTGPGTNSYLVGDTELAIVDPGPADARHADNVAAAAEQIGLPLSKVLVTHTHRDHSPGAQALAERFDLELIGPGVPDDGLQDEQWQPHRLVAEDDRISIGNLSVRVIATPGHVGNHLCYLLEERRALFTGDHLIHGSTVVIAPPSGSMSAYIDSLYRLQHEDIAYMLPGHGELIRDPQETIAQTIAHRLKREEKVADALATHPGSSASELVKEVYTDVPAYLHTVATLSLEAHLIKLVEDGRAKVEDGRYTAT
jgi:glyoxylase-like metal-dependent hydrolase (beta-lactamase superfamily II)